MIAADADMDADAAERERAWAAACEAALPRALRDALHAAQRLDDEVDAAGLWLAARAGAEDEGDADAIAAAGRRARSVARNERREGGKRGPKFFYGDDQAELARDIEDLPGDPLADPLQLLLAREAGAEVLCALRAEEARQRLWLALLGELETNRLAEACGFGLRRAQQKKQDLIAQAEVQADLFGDGDDLLLLGLGGAQ